ncbi:Alg9-like mannosyltransferase family-domain-containing protein [Chytridium lagenaria]|nr:Alg9-like mannosyltransferase family-domain-containing protein [Chytridium lagenaria]
MALSRVRLEITALIGPILVSDIFHRRRSFLKTFFIGLIAAAFSIGLTVAIDSYFWKQPWFWPEFEVFRFNILANRSVEYGVSPFHAFFTSLIPRIAPVSFPLSFYAVVVDKRIRRIMLPAFIFVVTMSFIPHKEWRFVIYVVPLLNIAAATTMTRLYRLASRKNGLIIHRLGFLICLGGLLLSAIGSQFIMALSSVNYPGGMALYHLHNVAWPHPNQQIQPRVHIDALAASTGITQFCYLGEDRGWEYDKDENLKTPQQYIKKGYTHLLTGDPAFHLKGNSSYWEMLGAARGFHSISICDGKGPQVWAIEAYKNVSLGKLTF